jgi:hypothetical protein
MEKKGIMSSKLNYTQRDKYHTFSFVEPEKVDHIQVKNRIGITIA